MIFFINSVSCSTVSLSLTLSSIRCRNFPYISWLLHCCRFFLVRCYEYENFLCMALSALKKKSSSHHTAKTFYIIHTRRIRKKNSVRTKQFFLPTLIHKEFLLCLWSTLFVARGNIKSFFFLKLDWGRVDIAKTKKNINL